MKILNTILLICIFLLTIISLTYDELPIEPLYEQSIIYLESQDLPSLVPNIQQVIDNYKIILSTK